MIKRILTAIFDAIIESQTAKARGYIYSYCQFNNIDFNTIYNPK